MTGDSAGLRSAIKRLAASMTVAIGGVAAGLIAGEFTSSAFFITLPALLVYMVLDETMEAIFGPGYDHVSVTTALHELTGDKGA